MLGGVAIFDYNGDGRPDIFFVNGANIATLKKRMTRLNTATVCFATMEMACLFSIVTDRCRPGGFGLR